MTTAPLLLSDALIDISSHVVAFLTPSTLDRFRFPTASSNLLLEDPLNVDHVKPNRKRRKQCSVFASSAHVLNTSMEESYLLCCIKGQSR